VGVFISPTADSDEKIQDWNYRATKEAIKRAVAREPKAADVVAQYKSSEHPFGAK
jgi:5,6,7,8-tetrahydromethanopterin hydro-lyase